MKIKIPAENYESLSRKLVALNNKAQKLGLDEISLDIHYSIGIATPDPKEAGEFNETEFLQIEVIGEPPVLDGWKFVGIIEPTELGNLLIEIRSEYPIPEKYRHTDLCDCEHCGVKRERNTAFVVMNEDTKEFLQVGRVCLKSYTSETDPKNIALYESFFKLKDFERPIGAGRSTHIYNPEKILAFYFKGVELYPDLKDSLLMLATKSFSHLMLDSRDYFKYLNDAYKDIMLNMDEKTYEKVTEFKNSIIALDDTNNNRIWNYKLVLQEQYTANPRLVIESIEFKEAHDRHLTIEAKRLAEHLARLKAKEELLEQKKTRQHVGVKDEKTDFHVRLERVQPIANDYGGSLLHVFRDKDENNISCFHSGVSLFTPEEKERLINSKEMFYLQGTVKGHGTYNDEPQTKIIRMKYLGSEKPEPKAKKANKKSP